MFGFETYIGSFLEVRRLLWTYVMLLGSLYIACFTSGLMCMELLNMVSFIHSFILQCSLSTCPVPSPRVKEVNGTDTIPNFRELPSRVGKREGEQQLCPEAGQSCRYSLEGQAGVACEEGVKNPSECPA